MKKRLENGRIIDVQGGVLGISLTPGNMDAYEGAIGIFLGSEDAKETYRKFTKKDRKEIAAVAIARWKEWGGLK